MLYVGLMSGTSLDGIDVVAVDFERGPPQLIASHFYPYEDELREKIAALCTTGNDELNRLGELDVILGLTFGQTITSFLNKHALLKDQIRAIGTHGQTIRHSPHTKHRFSLQIGDPNVIAATTGITTVADFRRKDIALGGQGAPLVPAFHQYVFKSTQQHRVIVNIGGMANITLLPSTSDIVIGFDTGPGNVLLDAWIQQARGIRFDRAGEWARGGQINQDLLGQMLADTYFQLPPPKSTGREYFNLAWIKSYLTPPFDCLQPADVQATLAELTVRTIMDAVSAHFSHAELLICGGGTHNRFLMERLQALAKNQFSVNSTAIYDFHPDWIEAITFAWLARQTLQNLPGNLPSVTGAKQQTILGAIYPAAL